ncbi:MAG: hypothetical protein ABGX75_08815 [Chromohalobacter sp.]|uniref:hypothetical protein n=2 Tax=Chromohalobacter sp. TaxID=50740 RepID=UPI0032421BF3
MVRQIFGNRPMTDNEYFYARKITNATKYVMWFLAGVGGICILIGGGLIVAFWMDSRSFDLIGISLIMFLAVGCLCAGAVILRMGMRRRICMDPWVSMISGKLTIVSRFLSNPATGVMTTIREYYIGDVLLTIPPGSNTIFDRLEGQVIVVHAVFVEILPRRKIPLLKAGSKDAIVFNLKNHINLDKAFEKYGRDIFLHEGKRLSRRGIPALCTGIALVVLLVYNYKSFSSPALFVGLVVAIVFVMAGVHLLTEFVCKKFMEWRRPGHREIPLREKLKG